jgi:hypothetical protein
LAQQASIRVLETYKVLVSAIETTRRDARKVVPALVEYPQHRLGHMFARQSLRALEAMREAMVELVRDVSTWRQRFAEMRAILDPLTAQLSSDTMGKRRDADDEILHRLLQQVTPEDYRELDRYVQKVMEIRVGSIGPTLLTPNGTRSHVLPTLVEACRAYFAARPEAAELLLPELSDPQAARVWFARAFAEAEPGLEGGCTGEAPVQVLAVPPGPAGDMCRQMAMTAFPNGGFEIAECRDAVVLYRELPWVPLHSLAHAAAPARQAYQRFLSQNTPIHTRTDIRNWLGLM